MSLSVGSIVTSLVNDIVMPPIGLLLSGADFSDLFILLQAGAEAPPPYATLADAQAAGAVTINYGVFLNTIINFLIVAFVIFLVIRQLNQMKKQEEAAPSPPPEPTAEEKLLREIRDLLAESQNR